MDPMLFLLVSILLTTVTCQSGGGSMFQPGGLQCRSDLNCPLDLACAEYRCINPCRFSDWRNCKCMVVNHRAICYKNVPNPLHIVTPVPPTPRPMVNPDHGSGPVVVGPGDSKKIFYIPDKKLSWLDALDYCNNDGGMLAIIENEEENNRAASVAHEKSITLTSFWIGGQYHQDDGKWWWHFSRKGGKGKQFVYKNFFILMDSLKMGDCLSYSSITPIGYFIEGYRWLPQPCSLSYYFICEKKQPTNYEHN